MAKKITIDDLARMTQDQFHTLDKKMDEGFGLIDKRFGMVDKRFGMIDERIGMIDERMKDGFGMVLDELKGVRDEMRIGRQASRVEYGGLKERVEKLERDMETLKVKR